MKKSVLLSITAFFCITGYVSADTFGTGANQFEIDFVPISGDSGDLGSWSAGSGYTFSGVNHDDYRIGKYEITNDQWNKFRAELGVPVTGNPSGAYDNDPTWSGASLPTNVASWYEAAQFVNWLNTYSGYQAAYKFAGTQGQSDYTMSMWDVTQTDGTNLYRHKDAYYFLPTEDEWVKAAYWNGTSLQNWATVGDHRPGQSGCNYYYFDHATDPPYAWAATKGSTELNGTKNMMGNVWEWMETPYYSDDYLPDSRRAFRGGSYERVGLGGFFIIESSYRGPDFAHSEDYYRGFRVASVPEPCSLVLLGLGGLVLRYRKR